jgi:hypothetical protein
MEFLPELVSSEDYRLRVEEAEKSRSDCWDYPWAKERKYS